MKIKCLAQQNIIHIYQMEFFESKHGFGSFVTVKYLINKIILNVQKSQTTKKNLHARRA